MYDDEITVIPFDLSDPQWGLYEETGPHSSTAVDPKGQKTVSQGPLRNIRSIGGGGIIDITHNVIQSFFRPVRAARSRQAAGTGLGSGRWLRVGLGLGLGGALGWSTAWAYNTWGILGGLGVAGAGLLGSHAITSSMGEVEADQFAFGAALGGGLGAAMYYSDTLGLLSDLSDAASTAWDIFKILNPGLWDWENIRIAGVAR